VSQSSPFAAAANVPNIHAAETTIVTRNTTATFGFWRYAQYTPIRNTNCATIASSAKAMGSDMRMRLS